jgi:hypothetical protein
MKPWSSILDAPDLSEHVQAVMNITDVPKRWCLLRLLVPSYEIVVHTHSDKFWTVNGGYWQRSLNSNVAIIRHWTFATRLDLLPFIAEDTQQGGGGAQERTRRFVRFMWAAEKSSIIVMLHYYKQFSLLLCSPHELKRIHDAVPSYYNTDTDNFWILEETGPSSFITYYPL